MKARFLIILSLFFFEVARASHPVHVSVVNLDIQSDSNRIKYSVCLFFEDLQSLINFKYNTLLDFRHQSRMTFKEQQSILEYLNSSFILKNSHNIPLNSEFKNWKIEDNLIWFFFCIEEIAEIRKLTIENKLMLDLFMDQKNLLILNNNGKEEGYEFNKRNASYIVTIGDD
ncbi:MAG: hypothetical protein JXB24_11315 [Bacteroidales bacterium]|nr:hypothetical protein [Bacteroidales bacterium]